MTLKLLIGNLCDIISIGTFATLVFISIQAMPLKMSILWAVWFVSTAIPVLQSPQQPIRDIPMQTVVVQHPDGTLSLDSKPNP